MKSFDDLIGPETRTALAEHGRLMAEVSRCVPPQAAPHLVHCRLVDDRLRLVLDNAAWVARLRFGERQLLRSLAAGGTRVRQVSWHVAPPDPVAAVDPRRGAGRAPRRIADAQPRAAAHVASVASGLAGDPVGRALAKLASSMARRVGASRDQDRARRATEEADGSTGGRRGQASRRGP